jgi:hypothetical protein
MGVVVSIHDCGGRWRRGLHPSLRDPARLPFVVKLLSAPYCEFAFDQTALEVHFCRYHGEAFLACLHLKFFDLFAMEQEFPAADGLMVFAVSVRILADVRIYQPGLIPGHLRVGVLELDLPRFRRLYLGAGQLNTGFQAVGEVVVVPGLAVVAEYLYPGFHKKTLHVRKAKIVNRL